MIQYSAAVLFVRDIEVSKRFYLDLLGQAIELDFGSNVILHGGLTLWQVNPQHIIPQTLGQEAVAAQTANRFELYFETAEIDLVVKRLSEYGAELLHALHEEPWGQRTIRFFDPDWHLIEVGETLQMLVKRLASGGLRPEQIAAKTFIPLEKVQEWIEG